jgi:3-isopropylmalate/(R)-2-methylmalate dehydratase small subunit
MGDSVSVIKGKAHVYGDNIDTDRIIPGKYTKTLDLTHLADHVLEDLDPTFRERVRPGDILVAGENFGTGSSREQAPLAIKAAGVSAVVAKSFARIFYRNAVNIGLPVVEASGHQIENGDVVEVDLENGQVFDQTSGATFRATRMPGIMIRILQHGGLVNFLKKHGSYD